jgi:nucleoside phosphorylase
MVRVLIAHDREEALNKIHATVLAQDIPEHLIEHAEDGQTIRAKLSSKTFDLAIFDLTMPAVKGISRPEYSTCEDIFVELFRGATLNVPGDIIGVTMEQEALTRIQTGIGSHLMAVVQETKGDEWTSQLADRISYIIKSSSARLMAASKRHEYDAAIITALDEEFDPFRKLFEFSEVAQYPGAYEFVFRDRSDTIRRGVIFSVGGAGQAACASATQAMIARFRPRVFILSGFCGGYEAKAAAGEVIFFKSVFDWDSGKWESPAVGDPVFQPRPDPISIGNGEADRILRSYANEAMREHTAMEREVRLLSGDEVKKVTIKPGLAASGSAVIANSDILKKIREPNDRIVAIDMESYGFYKACISTPFARPEMLCIKTIADFCDGEKHDRLHSSSCYSSAKVTEDLLLNRWKFE